MRSVLLLLAAIVFVGACQSASTKNTDSGVPNVATDIKEIAPAAAQTAVSKAYSQFIDVRTPEEYAGGHAARAENIPLDTLTASFDKLEKNEPVYIICQTGNRSKKAAEILKGAGFNNVFNVTGGTVAWQAAGLPMENKPPHNLPPAKNSNSGS
jgi:rhodanese-related sulfurtransferase